jgi:hypothetical protein
MVKISKQFGSFTNSKGAHSGRSAVATELITIGGTGGAKSGQRHFQRLGNEYEPNNSHEEMARSEATSQHVGQSDASSGDEIPLHKGDKISQ